MSGIVADFVQDEKGRIDFELVRMNRKTLGIHIGEQGQVIVKAPKYVKRDEISRMVLQKAGWIGKSRRCRSAPSRLRLFTVLLRGALFVSWEKLSFAHSL